MPVLEQTQDIIQPISLWPAEIYAYLTLLKKKELLYLLAPSIGNFHYPMPAILSEKEATKLYAIQTLLAERFSRKVHAVTRENLQQLDSSLHIRWNCIGSDQQLAQYQASLERLSPNLVTDYYFAVDTHGNPVCKILEISPRISYTEYRMPDVATIQKEVQPTLSHLNTRMWSQEKEIDALRKYRWIDDEEPVYVLKHSWRDCPVIYDVKAQAEWMHWNPIDPVDVFIQDGKYFAYIRNEQGEVTEECVELKYIFNVMTEEDFKWVEQKITCETQKQQVASFLSEWEKVQWNFPPMLRKFLWKNNLQGEFIEWIEDSCMQMYNAGETVGKGEYMIKYLWWVSGKWSFFVLVGTDRTYLINSATLEIEEELDAGEYTIPEWYLAQKFMFPFPVTTDITDAEWNMTPSQYTYEIRCMSPRGAPDNMPVEFVTRKSDRRDIQQVRNIRKKSHLPSEVKRFLLKASHPYTNLGRSLTAYKNNRQHVPASSIFPYGDNGIGPLFISPFEVQTSVTPEHAQDIQTWISSAIEKEQAMGIPDGIRQKSSDQIMQMFEHGGSILLSHRGKPMIHANVVEVSPGLYKIGTVITNPAYEWQGRLWQIIEVVLAKFWGHDLYLKSCNDALLHKFGKKWFKKYTREELENGTAEMKDFLVVIEQPSNWGITSPNKYILTNKVFN